MLKRCFFIVILLVVFVGSALAQNYFPLEPGMRWFYSVTQKGPLGEEVLLPITRMVFSPSMTSNQYIFPVQLENGAVVFFSRNGDGVRSIIRQTVNEIERAIRETPMKFLVNPVMPGSAEPEPVSIAFPDKQWSNRIIRVTIEGEEEVTVIVPAGTFSGCLKLKTQIELKASQDTATGNEETISVLRYDWFAPGVGWIKRIEEQADKQGLFGGNITVTYELLSFSR
ncbi:MAG: hypothetical protein Q8N59_02375 [bacterium]|nr:hypothetical protein [bacterium]